MQTQERAITLVDAILPRVTVTRDILLVISFAAVTALCAKVSFHVGLVPVTGQTFAVLLAGALLGSKRGAMSQVTYLAIGAVGMPFWFAPTTAPGVAAFAGPTAGYLVGFVPAAFAVGFLVERGWDRRVWTMAISLLLGLGFIYALGLSWLAHFMTSPAVLLTEGLYKFLPGEAVKLAMLSGAMPLGWALMNRMGRQ